MIAVPKEHISLLKELTELMNIEFYKYFAPNGARKFYAVAIVYKHSDSYGVGGNNLSGGRDNNRCRRNVKRFLVDATLA